MIGGAVTTKDGVPIDGGGKSLSRSEYQPTKDVLELFSKCQLDYQRAWALQHRPFDEFDGKSLLERAKADQETFGAFVGAEYVAPQNRWRWRGRKNTARNKLISILAHVISGMLYPLVSAQNEDSEEDKDAARVMRIIVENHLKKAGYEVKFMYMALSALVNPAVHVEVLYLESIQRIKERGADGTMKVTEAIDTILSGLNLNLVPIDEILPSDYYTNSVQAQPYIPRVKRIPWDTARKIYAGRFKDENGKDLFGYVKAGKTRVVMSGQEGATLYDIEWTEGDANAVQVLTMYYRDEDLELDWVGGVGMFNYQDPYNSNPFTHRRMSLIGDEWKSIPIYPFAKGVYEPIDPTGRFYFGKSGAFKEYWEDRSINHGYRLLQDGLTLEVIKPIFLSGVTKVDQIVISPGRVTGMPQDASVTPWSMSPNLSAAFQLIAKNEADLSSSTTENATPSMPQSGVPAAQTLQAVASVARQLSVFGLMIADLVKQVGELVIDCTVQHTFQGELDASVPTDLVVKYQTIVARTKENGKNMTNRIHLKSNLMGKKMSQKQKDEYEWNLWDKKGGNDQVIYHVNPYKAARLTYGMTVDADQIVNHAMGNDRQNKILRYQMLTQQFVYPFTDQKEVAEAVIEEFSDGDPDRFKIKGQPASGGPGAIMGAVGMGGAQPPPNQQTPPVPSPFGTKGAAPLITSPNAQ